MVKCEEYYHEKGHRRALEEFYSRLCMMSEQLTPEATIKILIQTFGGSRVSIPTLKYLDRVERNKRIRNAFHGGNYRELAARFGLTEHTIRTIVHERRRGN